MKFGHNMVTGKIHYDSAINCRNDLSKCTKFARYFTPNDVEFYAIEHGE
jgi:hypothetical protein